MDDTIIKIRNALLKAQSSNAKVKQIIKLNFIDITKEDENK